MLFESGCPEISITENGQTLAQATITGLDDHHQSRHEGIVGTDPEPPLERHRPSHLEHTPSTTVRDSVAPDV